GDDSRFSWCRVGRRPITILAKDRRSVVRSLGRAVVLLYTASCCRRARFSTASWRWPPKRNGRSRSTWSKRVIIEPEFSPDQRRQINDLPPAEVLAKDTGKTTTPSLASC